jgi:hypothetical protein
MKTFHLVRWTGVRREESLRVAEMSSETH